MDQSLFIFSFRKLSFNLKFLAGILFFLVFLESLITFVWHPSIIGSKLYSILTPYYDFGYEQHNDILQFSDGSINVYGNQVFDIYHQNVEITKGSKLSVFYGSSVTRGGNYQSNYPFYFNEIWREDKNNTKESFQFLNFSANGVGTLRINNILKSTSSIKPDLIFYHPHGSNEYEDERDAALYKEAFSGANGITLQSATVSIVKRIIDKLNDIIVTDSDATAELHASQDVENIKRWKVSINQNIKEFVKINTLENIPIIIIGRVERNLGKNGYQNTRVNEINSTIKNAVKNFNLCFYFDAVSVFEKQGDDDNVKKDLFHDDSHFTDKGHQVLARALFKFAQDISVDRP